MVNEIWNLEYWYGRPYQWRIQRGRKRRPPPLSARFLHVKSVPRSQNHGSAPDILSLLPKTLGHMSYTCNSRGTCRASFNILTQHD